MTYSEKKKKEEEDSCACSCSRLIVYLYMHQVYILCTSVSFKLVALIILFVKFNRLS